jgi:Uma2 family endonuclease
MLLELSQIVVPPGDRTLLNNLSWQEFEQILTELGNHRASRLSFSNGTLEIMTPLFGHENAKALLGDFVKVLLDQLGWDYESARSTTFKNASMMQAIEPDESFYIQNCQAIRGKERIDLSTDPPPDLAIEIEITSRTRFDNYQILAVPELWRYNGTRLQINLLHDGEYVESPTSNLFPELAIATQIPQTIAKSKQIGSAAAIREFRNWVREQISKSSQS